MNKSILFLSFLAILFLSVFCTKDQKNYLIETEEDRQKRMAWWKEAKFGMFIHWGLYSVLEGEYKGERPQYACLIRVC